MQPDEYRRMARVQDSHWWFAAKRRIVARLLERHGPPRAAASGGHGLSSAAASGGDGLSAAAASGPRVLEVGCGTGSMIPVLRRWGRVVAADAYLPALVHVEGARRLGADLLRLPFADGAFPLVACFDVLYHQRVADVDAALREVARVCAPGGFLVITDSAFPSLRSSHDAAVHGARRFRLPEMRERLEAAGLEVVHGTYFHTALFPVAAVLRLGRRLLHGAPPAGESGAAAAHSDLAPSPPGLDAVLGILYRVEAALACRSRLPFGLSLAVLARRRPV